MMSGISGPRMFVSSEMTKKMMNTRATTGRFVLIARSMWWGAPGKRG
jgi:hypothetical protein